MLSKRDRKYVLILALAAAAAVAAELLAPEPVDWTMSFERDDRRPYGSLITYELLPELFPGASIEPVEAPPYQWLRDTARTGTNYLFLTETFAPGAAEAGRLLDFAKRGNAVFVAAHRFAGPLADTLGLETERHLSLADDSLRLNFASPSLHRAGGYRFEEGAARAAFAAFDTARTAVLGTDSAGRATYLRIDAGRGALYLSTTPLVFANYHLLSGENAEYIYKALSYLPVQPVRWDAYYKPVRRAASSPLRFVLRDPALRAAYFLLLGLAVLFVLFEGKRRQRPIPVVAPPRNDTVAFVETIGRLYHQHGDHAALARKMIAHFFDYVRTRLNADTRAADKVLIQRVAERSGVPPDEVQVLFAQIAEVRRQETLSEEALHALSTRLEEFYHKSQR